MMIVELMIFILKMKFDMAIQAKTFLSLLAIAVLKDTDFRIMQLTKGPHKWWNYTEETEKSFGVNMMCCSATYAER
jgi:hypothetical protein